MKNKENKIFIAAVILYVFLLLVFFGNLLIKVSGSPAMTTPSAIPVLSVDRLNKVVGNLEKRTTLDPVEKIDLSQYKFGKIEPFNP